MSMYLVSQLSTKLQSNMLNDTSDQVSPLLDSNKNLNFAKGQFAIVMDSLLGNMKDVDYGIYQGIVTNVLSYDCSNMYRLATNTLKTAMLKVQDLLQYSQITDPYYLKKAIVTACTNPLITCESAIQVLLNLLNGNQNLVNECDLGQIFYEHEPFSGYRGWRNSYMTYEGFVINLVMVGTGIQAVVDISLQNDPNAWTNSQDRFNLQLRQALRRLRNHYEQGINEAIINGQLNILNELSRDEYQNKTIDDAVKTVQILLNLLHNNKYWIVQAYNNTQSQPVYRCIDCFTIQTYNTTMSVFIAGIDKQTSANTAVIGQDWIGLMRQVSSQDGTMLDFVNQSFDNNCILGVVAFDNNLPQNMYIPPEFTAYRIVKDTYSVLVWSVNERCSNKE
eukprot:403351285